MQRRASLFTFLACAAALGACAVSQAGTMTGARGVPGFDTRDYPGDAVMQQWHDRSPYRWVGYYLPAPCYTGTTWSGRRTALREMGWGFAVLYVGEQDWRAMRLVQGDSTVAVENPRCASANLTSEQGAAHAAAAAAAALADGFPQNTIIFLDVERVERVSPELTAYVRSFTAALLDGGQYVPGLYVHDVNTEQLYAIAEQEFVRRQRTDRPSLWVATSSGFDLRSTPAQSGYAVATVWQGRFNVRESWGGASLNIDANVADTDDPSRGR
jgi:hypothetical protein